MTNCVLGQWNLPELELRSLIRRCELVPALLRRQIEEEITALVEPNLQPSDELWASFRQKHHLQDNSADLESWLQKRGWSERDLRLHLLLPSALHRFQEQRYGPGVEEQFLLRKNDLDTVIYSLLRVKSPGLARELWISLSEGEVTFAELASRFSDGPEAQTKGVIGPLSLGSIEPVLAKHLRSLRVGQLRRPVSVGQWHVLLRLENLTPARLDPSLETNCLKSSLKFGYVSVLMRSLLVNSRSFALRFNE